MSNYQKITAPGFLSLGIVFLLIGFVQQGFTFSFQNGFFNLGIIFTLSGLAALALKTGKKGNKK